MLTKNTEFSFLGRGGGGGGGAWRRPGDEANPDHGF